MWVPTPGRTRLKVAAIGEPVTVDGVAVAPGDIVAADGTGIVVLPAARAEEITTLAEAFARDDAAAIAEMDKGLSFSDAMARLERGEINNAGSISALRWLARNHDGLRRRWG